MRGGTELRGSEGREEVERTQWGVGTRPTPVTSGTVPEVTIAQGADFEIKSRSRDLAPGISTASSP